MEKELLQLQLQNTAWWRAQKAVQYPEDPRNGVCAEALQRVAELIAYLPNDDLLFRRLTTASAVGPEHWIERQNCFIARWGFHGGPLSVSDFGPAFVAQLGALAEAFAVEAEQRQSDA